MSTSPGSSGKPLKRPVKLDLPNNGVSMKKQVLLSTPDVNLLKMSSPDLDKLLYNQFSVAAAANAEAAAAAASSAALNSLSNNGGTISTPTPTSLLFPNKITDEQEAYARGFVDALNELHRSKTLAALAGASSPSSNTTLAASQQLLLATAAASTPTSSQQITASDIATLLNSPTVSELLSPGSRLNQQSDAATAAFNTVVSSSNPTGGGLLIAIPNSSSGSALHSSATAAAEAALSINVAAADNGSANQIVPNDSPQQQTTAPASLAQPTHLLDLRSLNNSDQRPLTEMQEIQVAEQLSNLQRAGRLNFAAAQPILLLPQTAGLTAQNLLAGGARGGGTFQHHLQDPTQFHSFNNLSPAFQQHHQQQQRPMSNPPPARSFTPGRPPMGCSPAPPAHHQQSYSPAPPPPYHLAAASSSGVISGNVADWLISNVTLPTGYATRGTPPPPRGLVPTAQPPPTIVQTQLVGAPLNEETEKVERKRLRNRIAARTCRARKLDRIAELEVEVKQLNDAKSELKQRINSLQAHIAHARERIMVHVRDGCGDLGLGDEERESAILQRYSSDDDSVAASKGAAAVVVASGR